MIAKFERWQIVRSNLLNWGGGTSDAGRCSIFYVSFFFETYAVEQYSLSHVPFIFYIFLKWELGGV